VVQWLVVPLVLVASTYWRPRSIVLKLVIGLPLCYVLAVLFTTVTSSKERAADPLVRRPA